MQYWVGTWFSSGTWLSWFIQLKQQKNEDIRLRFPWFSDEDIKKLQEKTKGIKDEAMRRKAQDELYRKVLPTIQNQQKAEERDVWLNNLHYMQQNTKDPQEKWNLKLSVVMAELGTEIKNKFNLPADADDGKIITQFLEQTPKNTWLTKENTEKMFLDYLNNWNEELFYITWLKSRPAPEMDTWDNKKSKAWQLITDVVAWVWKWSRMGAEWLLEMWWKRAGKQVDKFVKWWLLTEEQWDIVKWKQQEMIEWIKAQSDIWEDKSSVAYKATKTVTEVAQILEWWIAGVRWIKAMRLDAKLGKLKQAKIDIENVKTWADVLKNKTLNKIWKAIQPKQTQTTIQKSWWRVLRWPDGQSILWRTSATKFKAPETMPTKYDIEQIKTYIDSGIDVTKTIETQANQIADKIWKEAQRADKIVKQNNKIFNQNTLKSRFKQIDKAPSDITPKNKEKIQEIFMEYLKKYNMEWLHKARQGYYKDNYIQKVLDWPTNDTRDYVVRIAEEAKWLISDTIPEYAKIMRVEGNLYWIIWNMKTKFTNKSKLAEFYRKNESLIKWLWYTFAAGYGGIQLGKYISWN